MPDFEIHPDDAEQRLDRFLRKLLPGAKLDFVFKLLRQHKVRVNGEAARGGRRLRAGDVVRVDVPAERLDRLLRLQRREAGTRGELSVLYEDADILAVDKPAFLPVHGGTGVGKDHLAAWLCALLGEGPARTFRPAPAHRLDRPCSGILLIGRSAAGLRALGRLFRSRRVRKTYLALLHGRPCEQSGSIEFPLERRAGARPKVRVAERGKPARSDYRILRVLGRLCLAEIELVTGRTHQIRAHFAGIGAPLLGDQHYGARALPDDGLVPGRVYLHAARVAFRHFRTGEDLEIEAPLPRDFRAVLEDAAT
ncbi:MAG: RluA family pseudouridine synthase [Planctomycetota bacterium]